MANDIIGVRVVKSRDSEDFTAGINAAVHELQEKGYVVDIAFAPVALVIQDKSAPYYTALITIRRRE